MKTALPSYPAGEWTDPFRPAPLRQVAWGVGAAVLVAAALSSLEISDWAFDLPSWLGPVRTVVLTAADAWHAAMQAIGLDRFHAAIAEAFQRFRESGWPGGDG